MLPYLIDATVFGFHLKLPTFGVILALSFSLAYFMAIRYAIKLGDSAKHIENLFLVVVLASIVGSRLFHVLFEEFSYYSQHPEKILAVWEGGYTLYGALITGITGMYIYCRINKISFLRYIDIAALVTSFGIGMGRLGCFAAGCCWGKQCDLPWAVTFTNPNSFTPNLNVPLHPAQLYESLGGFAIFFTCRWVLNHRKFPGQVFYLALSSYAVIRFLVEFFRGDDYRGYVFNGAISYSQLVSLAVLPVTLLAMYLTARKSEKLR